MKEKIPPKSLAFRPNRIEIAIMGVGLLFLQTSRLLCDVIYFTNGSVLVVEKAWQDGEQVKYQSSAGTKTLPKSSVNRIEHQEPAPGSVFPTRKYGIAIETVADSSSRSSHGAVPVPLASNSKDVSEETIKRLKENVEADPVNLRAKNDVIEALNSYASLQLLRGDSRGARNSLLQALSYDQRHLQTRLNLAVLNYQTGEYRAAEDLLVDSLQRDPKNQYSHYLLGEVYYAQDKISQAINEWKTAMQLGAGPSLSSRIKKAELERGTHDELGVLQNAHFILRYDRKVSDYHLGQEILDSLERNYRQLTADLTSDPPATITVILYPDQAYFDITRAPRWSGALFDGKIRVPIKGLSAVTSDLKRVLTHELTHSFISSLTRGNCPTWLNEGLAQFQEGKSAHEQKNFLASLQSQGHSIPLTSLGGSFAEFSDRIASLAYLEGLSAVEYLFSRHGRKSVLAILDLLRQSYNFESALKSTTGQTLAEFEKSWREFLVQ